MTRYSIDAPIPGVTFIIDQSGDPSGTELIWFHSEFGPFEDPPLNPTLASALSTRVVHLPGWGLSAGGHAFDGLPELALALWWLLDSLNVSSAILAGHGLGASVALEMAAQQPQRVAGVAAIAPYGLVLEDDAGADLFALLPGDLRPHLYADSTGPVANSHFPRAIDAHEKGLAAIRRVEVLGSASRFLFPLADTGISDRAYRLRNTPIELVWGELDGLLPISLCKHWDALLPSAESTIISGVAHMLPYEADCASAALERLMARFHT
jgi:pimeloyl-ACP methyl ester carboxylesterase